MKKIKFSIVIALAPWRDAEILSYLDKQDYPKRNFEIIVQKGLNVPINRNNGIKKSKGKIIIFLDDDAFIERDFLNKVEEFFKMYPDIDILGGPQLTPNSDKLFARANGHALGSIFAAPKVNNRYKRRKLTLNADSSYLTGALMICKKEVFTKIDFDEKVYPGDDVYFIDRAKSLGLKIAYSPDVFIYHRRRATIKGLIEQISDYAKLRSKNKTKNNLLSKFLFLIPSFFVIYVLLLPYLFFLNKIFLLPLAIYIIISILFSFYEGFFQKDYLTIPILPTVFAIIHISYGLGYLSGLIKKEYKPIK